MEKKYPNLKAMSPKDDPTFFKVITLGHGAGGGISVISAV